MRDRIAQAAVAVGVVLGLLYALGQVIAAVRGSVSDIRWQNQDETVCVVDTEYAFGYIARTELAPAEVCERCAGSVAAFLDCVTFSPF